MLIAGVLETERGVTDWSDAAEQRAAILARAHETAARYGCGTVEAIDLPQRYRGAQLFNNGFAEAFADGPSLRGRRRCVLTWTGGAFLVEAR
jgi:hypothetical protein